MSQYRKKQSGGLCLLFWNILCKMFLLFFFRGMQIFTGMPFISLFTSSFLDSICKGQRIIKEVLLMPTVSKAWCWYFEDLGTIPSLSCDRRVREIRGNPFRSKPRECQHVYHTEHFHRVCPIPQRVQCHSHDWRQTNREVHFYAEGIWLVYPSLFFFVVRLEKYPSHRTVWRFPWVRVKVI